jgi:hypothetical protein
VANETISSAVEFGISFNAVSQGIGETGSDVEKIFQQQQQQLRGP